MAAPQGFIKPTGIVPGVRTTYLPGGAAGDLTLSGIKKGDALISVVAVAFTLTAGTPNTIDAFTAADLTDEFSVTAADTINNGGGTSTAASLVVVTWFDHKWKDDYDADGAGFPRATY